MKKRMYAKPVLAHLGDVYQLTLANMLGRNAEIFDRLIYIPNA